MEPKAFEIYRHFKGNLYQIIALAEEESTGNTLVVYQGLYAPFKIYARPLSAFFERLDFMKYPDAMQTYRFERVTEIETMQEIGAATGTETETGAETETGTETETGAETETVTVTETETVKRPFGEDHEQRATSDIPFEKSSESKDVSAPAGDVSAEDISADDVPAKDVSAEGVNPDLLLFLDAREPEEKLDALFRIQSRLTPDMMTVMEMSQGMEPQEAWTMEERYKHIKNNIITKQKYEQKRL